MVKMNDAGTNPTGFFLAGAKILLYQRAEQLKELGYSSKDNSS